MKYFSTFITGTGEIVQKALIDKLVDVKIDSCFDGLVFYSTKEGYQFIKSLHFLNNSFVLIYLNENKGLKNSGELLVDFLHQNTNRLLFNVDLPENTSTFRIVAVTNNELSKVDKELILSAEKLFSDKFRIQVDKSKPDIEFWFMTRSEGIGIVGLRITKTPNYEKMLYKGELRPEMANIMCLLADLKPSDTLLDPFAGYGSIPSEAAKIFAVKKIFAGEKDKIIFKLLKEKLSLYKKKIVIGKWDGLNITSLTDKTIDKIITDPPWGFYDEEVNIEEFYKSAFLEFKRVLRPGGIIVLLSAQKSLIENMVEKNKEFELLKTYNILVSGKKASLFKIIPN